jgi:hypothetical protein
MLRERSGHSRALWVTVVAVTVTVAGASLARAAGIAWGDRPGVFERCLEGQMDAWVNARAALIVNDDPSASDVDDLDVALWAVTALQGCEQQAGRGNQTSEGRFARHMAHWREHIHSVAQAVLKRTGAD